MSRSKKQLQASPGHQEPIADVGLERLERRQLLSASPSTMGPPGGFEGGRPLHTIEFSLTPAAVQTGLNGLAATDGLTDPAATTEVALGNQGGVETYSVTIGSTGTVSQLTVDAAGDPVTAPTQSTITFGALASAPAAEITAIAMAKSLTAPTTDTTVSVTTTSAGGITYSVALSGTVSATPATTAAINPGTIMMVRPGTVPVTVDASGNPVGNQQLPFSAFSTAIQNGLNAGAPTGATALATTSTQNVEVRTSDGLTTYSTPFTVSGTDTTVTVNAAGAAVTTASRTTADFSTIPTAARTELQTLATAEAYTGTIATTESVTVYTETGGTTTLYAVTLSVTKPTTDSSTTTATHDETFVVDADGNPTTLSMDAPGPGGPPIGFGSGGPGGIPPGVWNDGGSTDGSSGSGSSSTGTFTSSKASAATAVAKISGNVLATILTADTPATPTLGESFSLFASAMTSATVLADLVTLRSATATFKSTVKGLSKTDAATLKADEKAIAKAVKAIGSPLTADQKALRSDGTKYAATLRADQKAIRKDAKDSTAPAADEATLASDEATAYAVLSADLDALKALINADAGVTAAQSKLSTDLPAVATAQGAVASAYTTVQNDVGAALTDAAGST